MREVEIMAFVSWLGNERRVSASTQNQALSAVLFLYRHVLGIELPALPQVPRAVVPTRVPVVMSPREVRLVIDRLSGLPRLVAALLYGSGLRLHECLELRVKDIDFERGEVTVRRGKGQKDRRVMLPPAMRQELVVGSPVTNAGGRHRGITSTSR